MPMLKNQARVADRTDLLCYIGVSRSPFRTPVNEKTERGFCIRINLWFDRSPRAMATRPATAGGSPPTNNILNGSPLDVIWESVPNPDENPFAFGLSPTAPPTAQQVEELHDEHSPPRQQTAASYMPAPPWSAAVYLNYTSPITSDGQSNSPTQRSPGQATPSTVGTPRSADGLLGTDKSRTDVAYSSKPYTDSRGGTTSRGGTDGKRRRRWNNWIAKVGGDEVYINGVRKATPIMLEDVIRQDLKKSNTLEGDVGSVASVKVEMDLEDFDDEDSPYPEVRASVSNIDDPDMPVMTIRMWFLGMLLCYPMGAANVFFSFRAPTLDFQALIPLLLCYPLGKFLAAVLPITRYRVPLPRPFSHFTFTLNPGPWSIKEHTLIFIMGNACIQSPYSMVATTVLRINYNFKLNFWFSFLFGLGVQVTGFSLAGLCRRVFITPAVMIWPQTLTVCTLLNTLHAEDDYDAPGITRYRFFIIITSGAFFFFFLPGFLFQALSVFSFICWIKPKNVVINQLFGANTGLGLNFLSFDWTQISWTGSPLVVPWWAELHIFSGFVFFYCIIFSILYYTNVWQMSHFPMLSSSVYDRFGKTYNYKRVLTPDLRFNETAYNEYSPLYLSGVFVMTYLVAFAISTNVIVHAILYHGKTFLGVWRGVGREEEDIHAKLMRSYPVVPDWWYVVLFAACFALQIVLVEVWHLGVPVWMLLLSIALPIIYIIPTTIILAMAAQSVPPINLPIQTMVGVLLPGKPVVNLVCKAYAVSSLTQGSLFLSDLKFGHYMKIPPRSTFFVQLVGAIVGLFIQVGVQEYLFSSVPNICQPHAPNGLVCPHSRVYFTASVIWGIIGPKHLFGPHTLYRPELFAILAGALLPFPFWLWRRRYPRSWVRYVATPVFLSGATDIPPATGINYTSWFAVAFIFQYWIRRRNFTWWLKYNYMASIGLDVGTSFAVIVIFFAFLLRTNPIQIDWWGNNVFLQTADYLALPFRPIPSGKPLPWPTPS